MIRDTAGAVKVYGHEAVQSRLLSIGPRNVLIYGPHSVGKKTLIEKYIEAHEITDVIRLGKITTDNIDGLREEALIAKTDLRAIVFNLGTLTLKLREKLLKIVEDAPSGVIFLVTSGYEPGITLKTRFTSFKVGYLSDSDVTIILMKMGYSAERAAELALFHTGSIWQAVEYGKYSAEKPKVLEALTHITTGNVLAIDSMYSSWEDEHTQAILEAATEKLTSRYRRYTEAELENMTKGVALKILTRIDPYDRPRYVTRATLAVITRENEQ